MNVVPPCGAGNSWCILFTSATSCSYNGDIFDYYFALESQPLACSAANDATVCRALSDLYNATNGASWKTKTGWSAAAAGTPTDYCTFYGAGCNNGILQNLCVRRI